MTPTVVIAPDSFKGSLGAADVARAIARGWTSVRPRDVVVTSPQADGGEGTLDAIEASVPGSERKSAGLVTGADGAQRPGEWLSLPDGTAVIELAQCCGLPAMRELDPLGATTRGLGEVILCALEDGATSLIIGLGGSGSTDGGTGALSALGMRFTDASGRSLPDGGGSLSRLAEFDSRDFVGAPQGGVTMLTDVAAPLLGPTGAAAVFGPQKGADDRDIAQLEVGLEQLATVLGGDTTALGAGAAGGTAFGFAAAWGATTESGSVRITELTGLAGHVAGADVVITGEGRFDEQSADGKVATAVFAIAETQEKRIGVIAGQLAIIPQSASGAELWAASLTELAGSTAAAIADPERWLRAAGVLAAEHFS